MGVSEGQDDQQPLLNRINHKLKRRKEIEAKMEVERASSPELDPDQADTNKIKDDLAKMDVKEETEDQEDKKDSVKEKDKDNDASEDQTDNKEEKVEKVEAEDKVDAAGEHDKKEDADKDASDQVMTEIKDECEGMDVVKDEVPENDVSMKDEEEEDDKEKVKKEEVVEEKKDRLEDCLFEEELIEGFSFCAFDSFKGLEEVVKWSAQNNGELPDPWYKLVFKKVEPPPPPVKKEKKKPKLEKVEKKGEKSMSVTCMSTTTNEANFTTSLSEVDIQSVQPKIRDLFPRSNSPVLQSVENLEPMGTQPASEAAGGILGAYGGLLPVPVVQEPPPRTINVRVGTTTLRIPLKGDNLTVSWLSDEASKRYEMKEGVRPVLELTADGAELASTDLLKDVVVGTETLLSNIVSWHTNTKPSHHRYKEPTQPVCRRRF